MVITGIFTFFGTVLISSAKWRYSCACTCIVLFTTSGAPLSRISTSKIPKCLTRSLSSDACSTKEISSCPKTNRAPLESSAKMALRFAAISFVETEPKILVFAGVFAFVPFPDFAAAFAAAETVDEVGMDGDILVSTWGAAATGVR